MGRVLITTPLPDRGAEPLVRSGHELVHRPGASFSHSEIVALAPTVDGIVCTLTDRIDAAILGAGRLRVVANVAAGYDNIDLGAAARHNVTVCNTPGVLDEATADTAFLLLLAAARRFTEADSHLRSGEWTGWKLADRVGCELFGGTLGLVGFGRIGRAVARRGQGFGLSVIHHTRTDTGVAGWVRDLDELLRQADFVSLHVPLSTQTWHLIDRRRLALMKATAVLVNTARVLSWTRQRWPMPFISD